MARADDVGAHGARVTSNGAADVAHALALPCVLGQLLDKRLSLAVLCIRVQVW